MATPLYKTSFLLRLTSPHMRDGHGPLKETHLVRDTQWLLNGNSKDARNKNKPFEDFYKGSLDGEYGPVTASAVRLAKYYLGYPDKEVNEVCGPVLQSYLRGEKKIPFFYIARRTARLKKNQNPDTVRLRAFAKAVTQVGVKESPTDSNRVLYSNWYGVIGPWCAMFVTWCYVNSGTKRLEKGNRYAYVPYIVDDARAGRNGLHLTAAPERGDLCCFDWNGDGTADHVGIFDSWVDAAHTAFTTVEGNTSGSNWSNGGEVWRQTRYRYQVQAFVHILEP